jgi:gluconate 2-dehydrogenase subunit 3-like protein
MSNNDVSRRGLFHILGSVPVAAAAAGSALAQTPESHTHLIAKEPLTKTGPYVRQTFNDAPWKTVHVLCDLIIPADEKSGSASQAGVPEFLDDWIAFRTSEDGDTRLQAEILGGLTWLDRESLKASGKEFAQAPADAQKTILDRIAWPDKAAKEDQIWAAFFSEFRNLTVSGFFSSRVGVADLPYLGNTAVVEWKGCDPKVWAVIEQRMKDGYQGLIKPQHLT